MAKKVQINKNDLFNIQSFTKPSAYIPHVKKISHDTRHAEFAPTNFAEPHDDMISAQFFNKAAQFALNAMKYLRK